MMEGAHSDVQSHLKDPSYMWSKTISKNSVSWLYVMSNMYLLLFILLCLGKKQCERYVKKSTSKLMYLDTLEQFYFIAGMTMINKNNVKFIPLQDLLNITATHLIITLMFIIEYFSKLTATQSTARWALQLRFQFKPFKI